MKKSLFALALAGFLFAGINNANACDDKKAASAKGAKKENCSSDKASTTAAKKDGKSEGCADSKEAKKGGCCSKDKAAPAKI